MLFAVKMRKQIMRDNLSTVLDYPLQLIKQWLWITSIISSSDYNYTILVDCPEKALSLFDLSTGFIV